MFSCTFNHYCWLQARAGGRSLFHQSFDSICSTTTKPALAAPPLPFRLGQPTRLNLILAHASTCGHFRLRMQMSTLRPAGQRSRTGSHTTRHLIRHHAVQRVLQVAQPLLGGSGVSRIPLSTIAATRKGFLRYLPVCLVWDDS